LTKAIARISLSVTVAGGALMLAGAFFAPFRALFLSLGMTLLLSGVLGERLPMVYRKSSIVLLNAVLLFAALELVTGAVRTIFTSATVSDLLFDLAGIRSDIISHHYLQLPYYRSEHWSEQHWREHRLVLGKRYDPYVVWQSPRFEGESINIDAHGIRKTTDTDCVPDAIKVYMFGGSAMWGWGAPDWGTIPSYLQRELEASEDGRYCVVNYGEHAFVSMQEFIQLQLLLAAGDVPDVAIFYSGVNDVFAADQTGEPINHQNLRYIAEQFESTNQSLTDWLLARNTIRLARLVLEQFGLVGGSGDAGTNQVNGGALADGIIDTYLRGYEMVGALSERFGFSYEFVWQPYILAGDKPLSDQEQNMPEALSWVVELNPRVVELFSLTYGRIETEADRREHLHYMGDVLDEVETEIWIDTWGHVNPKGNEVVAKRIATLVVPALDR
jgi:hypothetical protein